MGFRPEGLATAIGSFPHDDPAAACDLILNSIPEIPTWPQLPATSFREGMEIQYSEGLPGIVVDEAKGRIYFDTAGDTSTDLASFYENYLAGNVDHFAISRDYSRGIYEMERKLNSGAARPAYFKNHVTGPVTFGLGRTDQDKRSIYYNDVFRDVVVKGMEMKARWLLRRFKPLADRHICFVDEPILSAFGSSTYVSVERGDVVKCLGDVVSAIHDEGALAGTHCCGNTEWPILIDAGVDIISFDAYQYGETIGYYPEQIGQFLGAGGVLAWGIVPSSEAAAEETPESLVERLKQQVEGLAGKGIEPGLVWERCLVTPSCGTGSVAVALAETVLDRLSAVSRILRSQLSGGGS
jgi:methionine synthase II (cobalamin-independent)